METQQDILSIDWQVDDEVKNYLYQTSVLAKFVATLGMFFAVLTTGKTGFELVKMLLGYKEIFFSNYIIGTIIGALMAGAVYFVISLFTFRFAVKLQLSVKTTDQRAFNTAWHHFKMAYRSMGIMFIIYTALMLMIFLF
ncbi:MAG: hypothetical protein H7Y86_15025 [Rhizobacter sp.]|nr:hypothetical protein [Ferruginibacter sp.]